MSPRRCVGALLAGGAASRLGGQPKGLLRIGEDRILDRAAAALAEATDELLLIANAAEAAEWLPGVRVVPDARPGFGPLSGIHSAITAAGSDVLVLAWDAPFVPGRLLRTLRESGEVHGAAAVVPVSDSPWGFEPLCGWFSARSLQAITTQLDAGDGRVGALAQRTTFLTVDVAVWGDPADLFFNVNTPDDLGRAALIDARRRR
jgi:molybdopterin-guanine dinucleotide biosynthesis protein A